MSKTPAETRVCTTCGEEKTLDQFEGKRKKCRKCRNLSRAESRRLKKEKGQRASHSAKNKSQVGSVKKDKKATVRSSESHTEASERLLEVAEDISDEIEGMEEDELKPIKEDFRKFLWLVWQHLNLPEPTPMQYDIAHYLQHGPNRIILQAFRGVGKSFITAAFVIWLLLGNPQLKILVVSASKPRADNFSTFVLGLIKAMPVLQHLRPRDGQRESVVQFDVGPAWIDQSPSVLSLGITSQITGTRADIIVVDDIEVPNNSATADMREKLLERTKEFTAVRKPLPTTRTIYLGTPQTEDTTYSKLPDSYELRVYPSEIPEEEDLPKYGDNLAPYIQDMIDRGASAHTPTDPQRFDSYELTERLADYGKAGYALQFMLNTQLSDLEKYPLKVRDLIVMSVDNEKMPMSINWLPDPERVNNEIPNLAMAGDKFYWPAGHSKDFSEFTGSVLAIDPSGRGKDETGYAVVKMLNGFLFVTECGGMPGGYDEKTLKRLAEVAKRNKVNHVIIEDNFGDGMYTALFKPVLHRTYDVKVEEVHHSGQKEFRIIDTLEPVMARHKLVVDPEVLERDFQTAQAYDVGDKFTKTLIHQMTRITYERHALKHDDRLDALAIAVGYWVEQMSQDEKRGIDKKREEMLDEELNTFMEHALRGKVSYGSKTFNLPQKGRRGSKWGKRGRKF